MTLRPTSAHLRAVVGALALGLLAAILGRADLMLLGLPLIAWLAVVHFSVPAAARRDLPPARTRMLTTRLHEDESTEYVVNASDAPGLLTTLALPASPGLSMEPEHAQVVGARQSRIRITPNSWGLFAPSNAVLQRGDALGAWRGSEQLQVPPLTVVPGSADPAGERRLERVLGVAGPHLSPVKGPGMELAAVREFRTGDRLNRINWRVTSRAGALHTNEMFTERDTDVLIVTDTQQDVAGAELTSLDLTVRAVSGLSTRYLTLGDRVALHDASGRIRSIPPASGRGQLRRISDQLARTARHRDSRAQSMPLPAFRSGTLTFVLSPLLSDDLLGQIGQLRSRGADVSVIDTLPRSVTDAPGITETQRLAWLTRLAQRRLSIAQLADQGVRVTPWEVSA